MTLKELIDKGDNYEIKNNTVDLFFQFIFAAGYLTISETQDHLKETSIELPNYEVKYELEKKLELYYKQLFNIDTTLFSHATNELAKIFSTENTNNFKISLEKLFRAFP